MFTYWGRDSKAKNPIRLAASRIYSCGQTIKAAPSKCPQTCPMKKYRNLRKNPLPRIGKGFFDFHLSSTNKSNTACQTSVSVPAMILSC